MQGWPVTHWVFEAKLSYLSFIGESLANRSAKEIFNSSPDLGSQATLRNGETSITPTLADTKHREFLLRPLQMNDNLAALHVLVIQ